MGMATPESAFWQRLKKAKVFDWAERLECDSAPGLPDVHGLINGVEMWVELKAGVCLKIRKSQSIWHQNWAKLGKKSFILWSNGGAVFVYSGADSRALMENQRSVQPLWVAKGKNWASDLRTVLL